MKTENNTVLKLQVFYLQITYRRRTKNFSGGGGALATFSEVQGNFFRGNVGV